MKWGIFAEQWGKLGEGANAQGRLFRHTPSASLVPLP